MAAGPAGASHPQHQPRRAGVPAPARRWVAEVLGRSFDDIVAVRRLPGSTSSVLHEMVVGDGDPAGASAPTRVVLRRYVHPAWRDDAGPLVRTEATALAAATSAPVAAPDLLAFDAEGDDAGEPALLMTRLPGRPQVHPTPGWLRELASIHERLAGWASSPTSAISATRPGLLPRYEPWFPPQPRVPIWTGQPEAWAAAVALVTDALPASEAVGPIHRDLHPANILFRRSRVSGVVDWVNACVGPFESDLARCRVNLVILAGPEAADAFLAAVDHPAARRFDPAWDLVVAVELLPDPVALTALAGLGRPLSLTEVRRALDDHVARIVATRR